MKNTLISILILGCLCGCTNNPYEAAEETDEGYTSSGRPLDPDVAEPQEEETTDKETSVSYYNPETGTRSTYDDLEVDFKEDGTVDRIEFGNGGWIDEDHIVSQEDNGGSFTITTDEGKEYTVEK